MLSDYISFVKCLIFFFFFSFFRGVVGECSMPLIQELRLYLTVYSIDALLGQNYYD